MQNPRVFWAILTMLIPAAFPQTPGGMTAALTPSLASPAPVGTTVTWRASVSGATDGTIWYRFRARRFGQEYQIIRDYSPLTTLGWTVSDHEGWFDVELSAQNTSTGEIVQTTATYEIVSRVPGSHPAVSPTSHPLVFLYSAAPCANGSRMQVEFVAPNGASTRTPFSACDGVSSMNFYLVGLYADSNYTAHHFIEESAPLALGSRRRDAVRRGPEVGFQTGSLPAGLLTETILNAPSQPVSNPVLLGSKTGVPVATDPNGAPIWYGPNDIAYITWPEAGGKFWSVVAGAPSDPSSQRIRKFDAIGGVLLETNAARVNQQLAALGRRPITTFHHDVRTLPDGRIVALAGVEKIVTDIQGPGPVDVVGDMVIVFDSQLNVVWTWDTFDWLDVSRKAVLGEKCTAGCPPFHLATTANDWTHGNSISPTADGNLLYSTRHQDWLIKINYANGAGDGHIIWRLGKDGDFDFLSLDTYPWFSHQHDANFEASDPSKLMLFDNGNTRVATLGWGYSRGIVLQLNEKDRTATPVLYADLGVYSSAVGAAQRLDDGNYFFDASFIPLPTGITSQAIEVNAWGQIVSKTEANAILYRSFRMTDLYTPD